MEIVFFGAYDADRHPRVEVLIEGLRARGHRVREVNVPLEFYTSQRVELLQHSWLVVPLLAKLILAWLRLWWRARRIREVDVVVVGHLAHLDVHLARWRWPDVPIAIDYLISAEGTALDRRSGSQAVRSLLRRIDRGALRAADIVVVDTEENRGRLPPVAGPKSIVTPVGVSREWFAAGPPRDRSEGDVMSVVFFGLFTPLQGAGTIGRAIAELTDDPVAVTMVGHGQDYDLARAAAAGNRRVRWIDWVPAADLPALVAAHDVCLGIFGTTPKARRVVPNKVYQGSAAGCAIVTGDTAPQRAALAGAARYVPCGDAGALAAVLRELATDAPARRTLRDAARRRAEEHFRPGGVVASLEEELRRIVPDATGRMLV